MNALNTIIILISDTLGFMSIFLRRLSMAHKSGECKEPGCNKDQWKDGWCRSCAEYAMQKRTILGLENVTKLLLETVDRLDKIEHKIGSVQHQPPPPPPQIIRERVIVQQIPEIKQVQSPEVHQKNINTVKINTSEKIENKIPIDDSESDIFIPSIEINTGKSLIRDTQTSTIKRNINENANRLGKLGGFNK